MLPIYILCFMLYISIACAYFTFISLDIKLCLEKA